MKELKIFEIKINGEREWVAAYSIIGALQFYCTLTDINLNEFEEEDDIVELPKEKWHEYIVSDVDAEITKTFAEAMTQITTPDIIAGTPYQY